jgi:hypothetical protein
VTTLRRIIERAFVGDGGGGGGKDEADEDKIEEEEISVDDVEVVSDA